MDPILSISSRSQHLKWGYRIGCHRLSAALHKSAVGSVLDEDEVRSTLDEQFEQNAQLTQRLFNAQFEQGAELTQRLFNAQLDAVESSLDGDEFPSTINSQFYDVQSAQDAASDNFEAEFVNAFDDLSEQQQQVVAQSVEAFISAQRDAEQTEEVAETAQQQTQEVAETKQQTEQAVEAASGASVPAIETAGEAPEESAETAESANGEDDGQELEVIEGLGETCANRLPDYSIESAGQPAQAGTETVVETAEVSEDRANEWVTMAQSQA